MIIESSVGLGAIGTGLASACLWRGLRSRGITQCLGPLLRDSLRHRRRRRVHALICVADHFEPMWGNPAADVAQARAEAWRHEYPLRLSAFRDSDGRPPRHSFFFPIDQYDPRHVDSIASLCRDGYGEVEIHLHHDHDTAGNLRSTLVHFKNRFAERHGLLGRRADGRLAYGFVHGNWALDNSRPDGRWCGVNNELDILRATGCYADFTLPSVPSATQTRTINQIYYATDDPCCPKSHDTGTRVGTAEATEKGLMIIQGPLLLDWRRRSIENGCLQPTQRPSSRRLDRWLDANIHVPQRPDWIFIKLHTHGAPDANREILLGEPMIRFHRALAERAAADSQFTFHYVTAREMYNLARAAEAGFQGSVVEARDWEIGSNIEQKLASAA